MKTHEQSRTELVALVTVFIVVGAIAAALIGWALTTPVTIPEDRMPQVAVTEYVEA